MAQEHIPQDVIDAFGLSNITKVMRVGDGMINQTFCVTRENGEKWIVQSLSEIFDTAVIEDAQEITTFLRNNKWQCPTFKKTRDGAFYVIACEKVWRVMSYVEHVSFNKQDCDTSICYDIGVLLGRLHKDLKECDYKPQFHIEGFHDQRYYLDKAAQLDWSTCNADIQDLAQEVQTLLSQGTSLFKKRRQLIHGDPRIENICFHKENVPFLFIDYDTFMVHSLYVDVGDCVRSLCALGKYHYQKVVTPFVQGYNSAGSVNITEEKTLQAFRMMTLELTLRFLIDSIEDSYFDWDRTKFSSRKKSNLHHVRKLWQVYQSTCEQKPLLCKGNNTVK